MAAAAASSVEACIGEGTAYRGTFRTAYLRARQAWLRTG